jgi:hypothetical protein
MTATERSLTTYEEIGRLIEEGITPRSLKTLIDGLPIEPDEKAALWLRAWSEAHRRALRRAVPGLYLG